MNLTDRDRPANLSQFAYEKIEYAIITAKLDFGEPLSENALATALNISKAPIRTALINLQGKGLVDIVPQSGCYVTIPNPKQIRQLLEARVILETNALKIAMRSDVSQLIRTLDTNIETLQNFFDREEWVECQICNNLFHRSLVESAGNRYLLDSYDNIVPLMNAMATRLILSDSKKSQTFDDHIMITDHIRKGDLSSANRLLKKHILKTQNLKSSSKWPERRATRSEYAFRDFEKVFS